MTEEDRLRVAHLRAEIDRLTMDDRAERQKRIWQKVLEGMNYRQRDKMLDRIAAAKEAGRQCVLEADSRRKVDFT